MKSEAISEGPEGIWCLSLAAVSGLTRVKVLLGTGTPCAGTGALIHARQHSRYCLDLRHGQGNLDGSSFPQSGHVRVYSQNTMLNKMFIKNPPCADPVLSVPGSFSPLCLCIPVSCISCAFLSSKSVWVSHELDSVHLSEVVYNLDFDI